MCCGKKMTVWVPKGYDYVEREVRCGNTQPNGDPYLCDDCEKRLRHVNWRQQAAENGERYEED